MLFFSQTITLLNVMKTLTENNMNTVIEVNNIGRFQPTCRDTNKYREMYDF